MHEPHTSLWGGLMAGRTTMVETAPRPKPTVLLDSSYPITHTPTMRTTIYVSDELWERVKEAFPTRGASDIVQTALRELMAKQDTPPEFAQERPSPDPDELATARKRLVEEARKSYEIGYGQGMKVGQYVEWWMLDSLARTGWDVSRWRNLTSVEMVDGKPMSIPFEVLLGFDEFAVEDTSIGLGFVHALKDLWESVVASPDSPVAEKGGDAP
jgi:hypothetical protein